VANLHASLVVIVAVLVPSAALVLSLHVRRSPLEVWNEFSPQVCGSILIAAIAGAVALALGAWAAVAEPRGATLALGLVTFLLGGQLIAIALIRLYNRPGWSWLYNASPVVVLARLARFGWRAR